MLVICLVEQVGLLAEFALRWIWLMMFMVLSHCCAAVPCRRGSDKPPGLLPEWNEYANRWMGPFVMEAINSRCGGCVMPS
jgi:hypothetical protein